ncbi:E3 ubiquitin-protein ligase RNF212B-like isoform X1 [Tachypleus tridentatus]|uniref:E3 ubiquitin-protein ligase RNF212B-like isoform X1 n=2 Tax=Tachypleus tridentatus TaxID=6853 RepID=UPI003FD4254B
MTDWIHCNSCYNLPKSGKNFSLTNCGHIYCSDCLYKCAGDRCIVCGSPCRSIQLSSEMKPDLQMYFLDPLIQLKRIQQIFEFQHSQQVRLMKFWRDQVEKISSFKDCFQKMERKLMNFKRDNATLQEENHILRKKLIQNDLRKSFTDTSEGITESPRQLNGTSSSETHVARNFYKNTDISASRSSEAYCVAGTEFNDHQYSGQVRKPSPSVIAGRLTLRTPPSGGRMGHIPGSPIYHGNSKTPVNQRNQGSLNASQLMCQQQSLTGSAHSLKSGQTERNQIRLPFDFKSRNLIRKAKVSPYSPQNSL